MKTKQVTRNSLIRKSIAYMKKLKWLSFFSEGNYIEINDDGYLLEVGGDVYQLCIALSLQSNELR